MSKFKVISRDATSVRYEGAPQYSGTYLGVDYIEFKNISSPNVIDWQIGDYVDYFRTGVRYKLYTLPMPKKVARVGSYGGAIEYSNVQFFAPTKDLEIAPFRDLVLNDNGIHFSTRQDVSTYEDVRGVARRIQACMDDVFPNKWRIEVYETDEINTKSLIEEVKEFSISQSTCLDALTQIYDTWKGLGWVHMTDKLNGQEVITIGRANVRDADNTTDLFTYGVGNGLTSIRKNAVNEGEFATRLYVYGSERNLPARHYNQFDILNNESVDIPNLMIPISEWGFTNEKPDPKKAYIQADDAIIAKYGLIPKTLYFDGSEGFEIYPSIQGLTMSQVREAMIELGQENDLLPAESDKRIDVIEGKYGDGDGSADDFNANPNITMSLICGGFDIAEQGKKTSEGVAKLSIKSGLCAGRELLVRKLVGYQPAPTGMFRLTYEVERAWDESTAMAYPNSLYPLNAGDEFVLLDIPMPDYYVSINEKKLLEQGKKMLADYTRVSAFYEPEINAIRMKEVGGVITPGMYMKVKDDDIIETEDHIDFVLIDSLSIDEITEIPTYKVTLREEKRAARTYSALEDMIEDAREDARQSVKRERQYTDRRWKSAQETLTLLSKAFDNFSQGINPVNVKTMAMLVGDESLQYKFTESRSSLKDVPCPLTWSPERKQMIGLPASLIHMTLDVETITAVDSRKAEDYFSWDIVSWWNKETYESEFLEDGTKSYYVYVIASRKNNDAWYYVSETDIPMYSEDYYYFLVGILNSEYDSSRDFVTLYGFTEVLPGQITTDVIRSADGRTYFDLMRGEIGGRIVFKSNRGGEKSIADLEDEIQDQIDGVVENWNGEGTPTLTNEPAVNWLTDAEKIAHINDTYINIEEYVDDETTPTAGQAWRWCKCTNESITDFVTVTAKDGKTFNLHWHPIADSDAVRALKELSTKADKSDLEVLTKNLKDGSTIVDGGLVMTSLVAVRNNEEEIEAFLNGSDFAEDTENGKLILAAGIPEGDADKLEERSAEATTRIYERGKIVTNNIEANGGKFKDVEVLGSSRSPFVEGAWIDGITNYLEDNHYSFNTSGGTYFPLSKDISESGRVITLVGSFAIYGSTGCRIYDRGKLYQNEYLYTGYASDLLPKTNKTDFGFELVRLMAVPYSATEVAWEVIERRPLRESSYSSAYLTGVIGGLRPKTLRNPKNSGSTNQYTLSILDHTIVCEEGVSANFTYTLPSSPEIGQHYEFIKVKASRTIIFKTTDSKKIFRIDNETSDTSIGIGASWGGKIELTYDGIQWLMILIGS